MVYIGDIDIPILTEKDTSIDRDVVEKNFVDAPPQRYELIPSLESGTYTALLHEKVHDRNESFAEQIDSVRSLPYRNVSECPIEVSEEKGYLAVDVGSISIIPSLQVRESEIDVRFLDFDTYIPAIKCNAQSYSEDFDVTEESVIPVPTSVQEVNKNNTSDTPSFSITAEETTFGYHTYTQGDILDYIPSDSDITQVERESPVRLFDGSNNRIYSGSSNFNGFSLSNGVLRFERQSDTVYVDTWDSGWQRVGNFVLDSDVGYLPDFGNYETTVETISENRLSSYRGFWVNRVTVTGRNQFQFNVDIDTVDNQTSLYHSVNTVDGYTAILVRGQNDGNINTMTNSILVDNLNSSEEYTYFIGFVPDELTSQEAVEYAFTRGNWKRSLKQR